MKRKLLASLLSLCLLVGLLPTTALAASYTDTDGHWAESAIQRWTDYGIVTGSNGKFRPDAGLTRGELAAILANLLGLTEKAENNYGDLRGDEWYAEFILKCTAAGIMKGDGVNCNGDAPVTREESMVMIANALGIAPDPDPDLSKFDDADTVANWAAGYMSVLTASGIVSGVTENTAAPKDDINRASTMTILHNAIGVYANEPGTTVDANASGIVIVAAPDVTITGEAKDILVSAGAQGGTTTLKDVTVTGTATVTAPGSEVNLAGETKVENVVVTEAAAETKVDVAKDATVTTVTTEAPKGEVTVAGKVETVTTTSSEAKVEVTKDATVGEIAASGENTSIAVSGKVENVTVSDSATNTTVEANKGSTITKVDNAAEGTTVSGSGKVENVTTSGNNTSVDTSGTKVEAAEGTTGTTAGNKPVEGGSTSTPGTGTPTTPPTTPSTPSGGDDSYDDVHVHIYSYTDNGDGTHTGVCYAGDNTVTAAHIFNDGKCAACNAEDKAASIKADGKITYYESVQAAVDAAVEGQTITLLKDVTLDSQIRITKGVTLTGAGNGVTLKKGATDWTDPDTSSKGHASIITVDSATGTVTLNNLTLSGAKHIGNDYGSGLNVYNSTAVLNNVTLSDNAGAGMVVNSSTVTATGLHTSGNGWAGVNIDKNADTNAVLTFDETSTFAEKVHVYSDGGDVTVNAPGYAKVQTGGKYVWAKLFDGGSGTEADPYLIATAEQFKDIYYAYNGKHFKLMKDITVASAYQDGWANFATPYLYNGTFDGNNHTITVSDSSCDANLFYQIYNATIKDLNVVLDYSLTVYCYDEVTFDNVDVSGEFTVTGNEGAYVIFDFATTLNFLDCVADVEMSGTSYNAVFVGYVNWPSTSVGTLNFTRCENKGSLVCNYAAMFIGNPNAYNIVCNVVDCVNSGTIQATNTNTVLNYYYAVPSNCYKTFTINDVVYNDIADGRSSAPSCYEDTVVKTTGHAIQGPQNTGMALTQNEDGTFTIADATIEGKTVDHYTVYVGVYAALKEGGSSRNYVTETISASAENKTTTLKNLSFVDTQWVEEHSNAVKGELAGNVIYTLDGESYYMLVTPNTDTLNGKTKAPQMIYVVAYDENDKTLASATLYGNIA